jgi:hypothetical protein
LEPTSFVGGSTANPLAVSVAKPNREMPTDRQVKSLWSGPVFTPMEINSPAKDLVLTELRRSHLNGGANFVSAAFPEDRVIDWFVSRNRFNAFQFLERFLVSSAFREGAPQIPIPSELPQVDWESDSPYCFDGRIAELLMFGGAYARFAGSGRGAKDLGRRLVSELFEERYEDVSVFHSESLWSDWFRGVAWDATWVGVDKGKRRIWALLVTDTD